MFQLSFSFWNANSLFFQLSTLLVFRVSLEMDVGDQGTSCTNLSDLTFFIPDTQRWQTLFQNNDKAAIRTLRQIYDDDQKPKEFSIKLNQLISVN